MASINRRSFIRDSAITAGLAAVSVPMVSKASENEAAGVGMGGISTGADVALYLPQDGAEPSFIADPVKDDQIAQTISCDLAVCGAGLAGNSTALSAAQEGLNVIVLEKGDTVAFRGSQLAGLDDRLHREAGVEFDKSVVLEDALRSNGYRCNRAVWQKWIELQGVAVDWILDETADSVTPYLTETGVKSGVKNISGVNEFYTIIKFEEGMMAFAEAVQQKAESYGAHYMWETPACQLVQDSDGHVTGVIARNPDGDLIKIECALGVALCTGSYDYNPDLMTKWCRPDDIAAYSWTNMTKTNVGDGHLMGLAAGGLMDPYPHVVMVDPGGMASHQRNLGILFPFLRVNQNGERFVQEDLSSEYKCDAMMHQPGSHDWVLFAGDLAANLDKTSYRDYSGFSWSKKTPEELAEQLMGDLIEAGTIEELAEKTGMPYENLEKTLARAQELYELGEDVDFGRDPGMLMPFDQGPYYAAEEGGSGLCVVSGLRITPKSEVIDAQGHPIAGLYAVGNASGDMFYGTYPHHINGISHSRCVTFGYALGKRVAGVLEE